MKSLHKHITRPLPKEMLLPFAPWKAAKPQTTQFNTKEGIIPSWHFIALTSSHSLKQTEEIRGLHVKLAKPLEKQAAFIMHITVSDQCHRKLDLLLQKTRV